MTRSIRTRAAGFTPKDAPRGNKPTKGYDISGKVTNVVKRDNAEDAVRAVTELRVNKILQAIKMDSVKKAG